jgi:EmrB/QacA subfamily drug resistance transporter
MSVITNTTTTSINTPITTSTHTQPSAPSDARQASAPIPASARPAAPAPVSRRRWLTLAVLCLSLLITVVDATIVNVALPTLAHDLRAGTAGLQWITDAYTLTFAALLLLAGALADRFGRHRALAAGLAVFAVGSLAAALTRTPAELIAARAVMGTGAAFIMPATLSILSSAFTVPAERAKAIGIWSAVSGLGVAIGPVAGGVLLAHFGWDSIFLVNLPLVALALAAGHWLVPASRAPQARRLDPAGAVLSVAAFTMLTWALIAAPASGWLSAATLARMGGAAVLLTAFAVSQVRSDHPMLPVSLFRNPRLAGAAVSLLALFFALSGAVFLTTQIYQLVLGYSPLAAGLRALPPALTLAVTATAGAHLAKRTGARLPVTGGLLLVTAGLAFFATATAGVGYPHYVLAMVMVSGGIGLAMSAATTLTMEQLPPALAGVGSAVNDATRNLGSVLGVAVVGSITASVAAGRLPALGSTALGSTALGSTALGSTALGSTALGSAGHAHAFASAFIAGSDYGVLAAATLTAATAGIALAALRTPKSPAAA